MIDPLIRATLSEVSSLFGLPIRGVLRSKSGEILLEWEWDENLKMPRRVK